MARVWEIAAHPRVVRGCRIVIGVIFVVAALAKIGELHEFAKQVHNFRLVPVFAENAVALTLPWIELVAGLALILNVRARSGGFVVAALMALFTVAVIVAMARGLDIECGCFGTADASRVGAVKILQNLGMLALSGVSCVRLR